MPSDDSNLPPAAGEADPIRGRRQPMPVVAIVGRPNVGKSSLLNALARRKIAIVQDMPGVTRDRVSTPLEIRGRWVELIDTGGYGFEDQQGLTEHIREQIEMAMRRAELVVFTVDAHSGVLPGDEMIAQLLRRLGRKVLLVANKADGPRFDLGTGDFARLGFGTPLGVSATTGRNVDELVREIGRNVDLKTAPKHPPEPDLKVAIVGKRNAGKSTLVNAISRIFEGEGQDRVIVSEVPGTTRDSVDVVFEKDGRTMVVIDTAGVRKKRHMVNDDIEFYSFHRAERSIRRADVVLLLIDATLKVSEPDKKLAGYVAQQEKPVIIVVNKWDLAKESLRQQQKDQKHKTDDRQLMEEYREYLDAELRGLPFAPVAFITAKDGRNVPALLDLCRHLHKAANERVSTGQLNAALEAAMAERTPGGIGGRHRPRIYYATQVEVDPPHIVLFVNDPAYFDESYRRFLLNRFRDLLPFEEVPIRLTLRARNRPGDAADGGAPRPRKRALKAAKPAPADRPRKTKRRPNPRKGADV
jgi:GTP-binding protein